MKGCEFKEKRIKAGISVSALSRLMKVDSSTITRWENGKRSISPSIELLLDYIINDKQR